MSAGGEVAICIVAEGETSRSAFAPLDARASVSVIEVAEGTSRDPSLLKRAVDGATADWILIVREGETVGDDLAAEIAKSAISDPRAWGYRIARRLTYCGRPIDVGHREAGEVRLYHRRKARLEPGGRMKVQGTVVRLTERLEIVLFANEKEHEDTLHRSGASKRGFVSRVVFWLGAVLARGLGAFDATTIRYLWIESGWRPKDRDAPQVPDRPQ